MWYLKYLICNIDHYLNTFHQVTKKERELLKVVIKLWTNYLKNMFGVVHNTSNFANVNTIF